MNPFLFIGLILGVWVLLMGVFSILVYVSAIVGALIILKIPTSRKYILERFNKSPYYKYYTLGNKSNQTDDEHKIRRIAYYFKYFANGYCDFWVSSIKRKHIPTATNEPNNRAKNRKYSNKYCLSDIIQKLVDIELEYGVHQFPHKANLSRAKRGCQPNANKTLKA
jgi:hypothetical protein